MFKRRNKQSLSSQVGNFFWPRSGIKRASLYVWHRVARISGTSHFITIGVASGVFASWTPFMGLHFILAALVAYFLRGSLLASALGTFFGNPFTFPFIWMAAYKTGGFLLGYEAKGEVALVMPKGVMWLLFTDPSKFIDIVWGAMGPYFVPMLVGGVPLGILTAIPIYFIMRPIIENYQLSRRNRLAENRARQRKAQNT